MAFDILHSNYKYCCYNKFKRKRSNGFKNLVFGVNMTCSYLTASIVAFLDLAQGFLNLATLRLVGFNPQNFPASLAVWGILGVELHKSKCSQV